MMMKEQDREAVVMPGYLPVSGESVKERRPAGRKNHKARAGRPRRSAPAVNPFFNPNAGQ
jgi:hypothetical protein